MLQKQWGEEKENKQTNSMHLKMSTLCGSGFTKLQGTIPM